MCLSIVEHILSGRFLQMTFYQELQLISDGSKALIRITRDKKERMRHILIYNFKVYLVVAFCFAAVTLFSMIFGNENSIAGVVVLLALLVLRQADFGIHTSHGLLCIAGIFGILMTGPRLSNMVSPFAAFFINLICILLLMLLGCHNVIMSNHSTFVLSYLILQGYDVSGYSWMMRTAGLFVGMLLCMAVFYKNQKHRLHKREFKDLFHEFDPRSLRNRWYIKLTLCVSTVLLIASLLGIPRAMWAGIACMSVCLPFQKDLVKRAHIRWIYNILGCMIFLVIYAVLPKELHPMIGLLGGIGVGYSAGYPWQTVFNTFGALSIASGLFGAAGAVILRIATNAGAAFYTALMGSLIDRASDRLFCRE